MPSPAPSQDPKPPISRDAFTEVVRDQIGPLRAYARVITGDEVKANEIVQDAFVAAWNNIGKFDVTRDISSWLRGIVRNKWREFCRRHAREVSLSEDQLVYLEQKVASIEADRPEVFDRLAHCRELLPESLADSVAAFYDDHLSTDEAAERLEINGATLRKRLERARQSLRECLEKKVSIPY